MSSTNVFPTFQGSLYWPSARKYAVSVWYSDGSVRQTFSENSSLTLKEATALYSLPDIFEFEVQQIKQSLKEKYNV
jgi:hypothetical protein